MATVSRRPRPQQSGKRGVMRACWMGCIMSRSSQNGGERRRGPKMSPVAVGKWPGSVSTSTQPRQPAWRTVSASSATSRAYASSVPAS